MTVRFGQLPYLDYAPWAIAEQQGYLADEGITFEKTTFEVEQPMYEAMLGGSIDVGNSGDTPFILAAAVAPELRMIALTNIFAGYSLMARPDDGFKTYDEFVADGASHDEALALAAGQLEDTTIILPGGTSFTPVLDTALGYAGLTRDDLTILDMDPVEGAAAFIRGEADFYSDGLPQRFRLEQEGMINILTGPQRAGGAMDLAGLATTQAFIDANPDVPVRLLRAWYRSMAFLQENEAEALQVISDWINEQSGAGIHAGGCQALPHRPGDHADPGRGRGTVLGRPREPILLQGPPTVRSRLLLGDRGLGCFGHRSRRACTGADILRCVAERRVILSGEMGDGAPRVVAQFLEGGTAFGVISPDAAAACLRRACATVPIDRCLPRLAPVPARAVDDVVADEARQLGCSVWLWQPLLSGDGVRVPTRDSARGPLAPVPSPNGKAEFAFDCPVRATGLAAALERLKEQLSRSGAGTASLLTGAQPWPSPSRDPSEDLACFCEECRDAAVSHDIDLAFVASCLASARTSPQGRLDLVAELLGRPSDGPLAPFLEWRGAALKITQAAGAAVERATSIRGAGGERLRVALDVFTPSLARSVGQDIGALAPQAEFVKAMTYLGTHGPAGLPLAAVQAEPLAGGRGS